MAKVGRKTKLTKKMQDEICKLLGAGNYVCAVCDYVGIAESTFYDWLERGEDGEEPFAEFHESVKREAAKAEIRAASEIQKAGQQGTWQAWAWFLERRYAKRWGRHVTEHTLKGEVGVKHSGEVEINDNEYAAVLAELAGISTDGASREAGSNAEAKPIHSTSADDQADGVPDTIN